MNNFFFEVLNKLNNGIIILDYQKRIIFWNHWMEMKTEYKSETVFNYSIDEVAPKFLRPKYSKILDLVIENGQPRFLAGAVHGGFFSSIDVEHDTNTLQNLQIERVDNNFILIQVEDHTGLYQKVQKMKHFIRHLEKENDEIRQNEELSRQMAMHDVLTGLPNRLFFMGKLRKRLEEFILDQSKQSIAVFFIDLDNLKDVNDQFGHRYGDSILMEMSKRLKNAIRSSDTVARLSGDEFVIMMEGLIDKKDIQRVSEHIIDQFAKPFVIEDHSLSVTCSMGISLYPEDSKDADDLLDKADQALYRVKNSGKAGYAFFNQ
ncbi:diguanylate cyclase domain-containing protein [Fusibacter bizertensis]